MKVNRRAVLGAAALGAGFRAHAAGSEPSVETFVMKHSDGRETTYRLMAPRRGGYLRVVLFSHGANSTNSDYDLLWRPWAERGYLVIGPNHIDSGPVAQQRKMTPGALWVTRIEDTALPLRDRAIFDAVAHRLAGRIDWTRVCAAGHSFGAVVAQSLAGATLTNPGDHTPFDGRQAGIAACMTFSPPGPLPGFIPADAWKSVTAPSLLQTGDIDVLPGFVNDWKLRLTGFAGAPDRWTIVARGVNHYFGGLICRRRPDAGAALPALDETARLSGAFLDAYLRGKGAALDVLSARAGLGDDGLLTFARAG
jgi:dienelactone hydrolase